MQEIIEFSDMSITLEKKAIKNIHLSVHPPHGRVTLVVPSSTYTEVARAYVASKLPWIRAQQEKFRNQARETPREFLSRESHYVWGHRYLMRVHYQDAKPSVELANKELVLSVRTGASAEQRAKVLHEWHKALLHKAVPPLIEKWEKKLQVRVSSYFLQRMKTRWGSCNHARQHIRLNTELVKKPRDLLEYVIVHEMAHLIEPNHSTRFVAILDEHYPAWRDARAELNALPLAAQAWK